MQQQSSLSAVTMMELPEPLQDMIADADAAQPNVPLELSSWPLGKTPVEILNSFYSEMYDTPLDWVVVAPQGNFCSAYIERLERMALATWSTTESLHEGLADEAWVDPNRTDNTIWSLGYNGLITWLTMQLEAPENLPGGIATEWMRRLWDPSPNAAPCRTSWFPHPDDPQFGKADVIRWCNHIDHELKAIMAEVKSAEMAQSLNSVTLQQPSSSSANDQSGSGGHKGIFALPQQQ